jgi:hypothetical protein
MTVTPAPILLGNKTILLNVKPNMMKKLANTFDAQELFKILPKKMSFPMSNVSKLLLGQAIPRLMTSSCSTKSLAWTSMANLILLKCPNLTLSSFP